MSKHHCIGLNLIAFRSEQHSGVEAFVKNVFSRVRLGDISITNVAIRHSVDAINVLGREFFDYHKNVILSRWWVSRTIFRIPIEMLTLSIRFYACDTVLSINNFGPIFGKKGQKRGIFVYDLWFLDSSYNGRLIDKYIFWVLIRLQSFATHHLFTLSESSRKAIVNYLKVGSNNVSVVPFCMKSDPREMFQMSNPKGLFESETPLKSDDYFLLVGSDRPNKNVLMAVLGYLQYLKENDGAENLYLVGPYTEKFLSTIRQIIPGKRENRIIFCGFVSDSEYDDLLRSSLGLVFLSLYEGLGIPVLEALCHNKPVLVCQGTVCQEIAGPLGIPVDGKEVAEVANGYRSVSRFDSKPKWNIDRHLRQYLNCEKGTQILEKFLKEQ